MAAAIINGALYLPEESMLLMSARAKFTAAMTSATPAQRAMSAERRSIIPFQTFASLVIACITGRKQWTIQFGSQFLYCGFLNNGICAVYGSYPQVRMSAPYGFVSALSASRLDKHLAGLIQAAVPSAGVLPAEHFSDWLSRSQLRSNAWLSSRRYAMRVLAR